MTDQKSIQSSKETNTPATANIRELSNIDKFHLERTAKTLFEAGKRTANSLLFLAAFVLTSAIFIFSTGEGDNIKIPLFGVNLPKWPALVILMVLISTSFYRFMVLTRYEVLLRFRIKAILEIADTNTATWHMIYPSVHHFQYYITSKLSGKISITAIIFSILYFAVGTAGVLFLDIKIGKVLDYSFFWSISTAITMFFFIMSLTLIYKVYRALINPEETIQKMDNFKL